MTGSCDSVPGAVRGVNPRIVGGLGHLVGCSRTTSSRLASRSFHIAAGSRRLPSRSSRVAAVRRPPTEWRFRKLWQAGSPSCGALPVKSLGRGECSTWNTPPPRSAVRARGPSRRQAWGAPNLSAVPSSVITTRLISGGAPPTQGLPAGGVGPAGWRRRARGSVRRSLARGGRPAGASGTVWRGGHQVSGAHRCRKAARGGAGAAPWSPEGAGERRHGAAPIPGAGARVQLAGSTGFKHAPVKAAGAPGPPGPSVHTGRPTDARKRPAPSSSLR